MRWNSIVFKIGATIFIILISILLPLIYTIDQLFARFYISEAHHQIDEIAAKYSTVLSNQEDIHALKTVANITKTEMCIIDQNGRIIFTSSEKLFRKDTQIDSELLKNINSESNVKSEYHSSINNSDYLVSTKPLNLSAIADGRLLVFTNEKKIKDSVHHVELLLLVSMLGALCIALGITYIASKKLASPLLQMEKVTRDVAQGKYFSKVNISASDEMGSLALAINDLGQELERYRNRQKEFFANVSHDLRTPISYIKGYTQVLHDRLYKDEKEKDSYLSIILKEANQMNFLINDLFELSKIEGGQVDLQLKWINIYELVENCLTKAALKAKQKGIDLHKELDHNIPFIYTDGGRLEQIIMNLLENAIRFNNVNGHVKLIGWAEKNKVHFLIEDTGMGIPKEDLPYIFERFYKADKSRSNRIGSTGLGLSIVKHLVLLLEGEINVKSRLNKGTTFRISLPFNIRA
ncbi:HAMP domain-containing sensor histidine kinase [Metabacillus arenae]|uniref:histidine kinase n=1 Tax=Metabacillus arenae TaxID=2771434 RepID=A0A926NML5_9BACI|nr:HAMP domain-containing sensor histidine kinase [Metabacillus arenae]MBD1380586.1 HAMP domain-containing histidine kinase [Metabacillus arenae]